MHHIQYGPSPVGYHWESCHKPAAVGIGGSLGHQQPLLPESVKSLALLCHQNLSHTPRQCRCTCFCCWLHVTDSFQWYCRLIITCCCWSRHDVKPISVCIIMFQHLHATWCSHFAAQHGQQMDLFNWLHLSLWLLLTTLLLLILHCNVTTIIFLGCISWLIYQDLKWIFLKPIYCWSVWCYGLKLSNNACKRIWSSCVLQYYPCPPKLFNVCSSYSYIYSVLIQLSYGHLPVASSPVASWVPISSFTLIVSLMHFS